MCAFVSLLVSKNGEKAAPPSEMTCPPGWILEDDAWVYDINRAVDEKGEKDAWRVQFLIHRTQTFNNFCTPKVFLNLVSLK